MIEQPFEFRPWFVSNWSRTALPAGLVLAALSPLVYKVGGLVLLLIFLQLPFYMLHQYEEHAHGRFRRLVNELLAGGRPKLDDRTIFWINIIGVWVLYVVVIDGAALTTAALGLMLAYTTVFNGLLHILMGVARRSYNPGLYTSLLLLVPVGGCAIYVISQLPVTTAAYQWLGIGTAVLVHVLTFGYIGLVVRQTAEVG